MTGGSPSTAMTCSCQLPEHLRAVLPHAASDSPGMTHPLAPKSTDLSRMCHLISSDHAPGGTMWHLISSYLLPTTIVVHIVGTVVTRPPSLCPRLSGFGNMNVQ